MERTTKNRSKTHCIVANHHTGTVIFPRKGKSGTAIAPIIIPAGKSEAVPIDDWNELKASDGVKNYLDHGIISEIHSVQDVATSDTISDKLPIPEHLLKESEMGNQTDVSAKVRRKTSNVISI